MDLDDCCEQHCLETQPFRPFKAGWNAGRILVVSEQFRSKRRTPTGGSLKQRFISFHPPIGLANGVAFFTMDQLQGHNIFRASWLQVTTYFNSISQERLQHKERGRFIARASVLPLAFSRQTQEVFAYHQHKNVSVGMCWDTFDSTPGVVFRLYFSDTFQTLAAHVPSKASHF